MQSCYFTAVDDRTALRARERGGPLGWDALEVVEARGVVTVLAIPRLLAVARGAEAPVDLGIVDHLWPQMPEDPQADLAWMAEPIVERLSTRLRDELAALDPTRAPELAPRWAPHIHWSVTECEQLVRDLVALARTARDQGRALYNWYELSAPPARSVPVG